MRLIISPLAPRPGRSLFVRTSSHPSRRGTEKKKKEKNPPNSRQFFSLHSKQSSEKINMHSHRKNCLYSGNGRPNPFRSIIPPIDMEGGRLGPAVVDQPRRPRSLAAASFVAWCPHVFLDAVGAAAARQGSSCLHSVSIGSRN